jgi:Flp pilus assembly protein CpaB
MSTNRIVLRILALLFFLAGLLLLRKPVFGQATEPILPKSTIQTITAAPTRLPVDQAVQALLKPWETESALPSYTSNPETDKA